MCRVAHPLLFYGVSILQESFGMFPVLCRFFVSILCVIVCKVCDSARKMCVFAHFFRGGVIAYPLIIRELLFWHGFCSITFMKYV